MNARSRGLSLIALGLVGAALYPIVTRANHPALLDSDAAHGAWIGVCIGLEIVGVWLLRSRRGGREA